MRQFSTENYSDYLTRFDARYKNLELASGGHIFCSLQIIGKKMHEVGKDEIEEESERFCAMCFLLCADDARYSELQDELKKRVYKR